MNDIIKSVDIASLTPFEDHPFKLRDGEELEELMASIKRNKIIEPLIVRPFSSVGKYEVISGHRRLDALKRLGVKEAPVIIKDLSDEEAVMMMVDSNLKRENILPSEKAFAYKMKLDVLKRQGDRSDLTSSQNETKFRSDEYLATRLGIGKETLHRYIRLTYLIPELLKMVDKPEEKASKKKDDTDTGVQTGTMFYVQTGLISLLAAYFLMESQGRKRK